MRIMEGGEHEDRQGRGSLEEASVVQGRAMEGFDVRLDWFTCCGCTCMHEHIVCQRIYVYWRLSRKTSGLTSHTFFLVWH